jgi:hypothetical protein
MTLEKFLKHSEETQIDFLVNDLSSLDDVVLFVSFVYMLHKSISYHVLRRSMDAWEKRLSTETRTISENEKEQFNKLLGMAIKMKFVGSFAENYDMDPKIVMARKQQLTNPTTKQKRRRTIRRKSRAKKSGFMVDLPIC